MASSSRSPRDKFGKLERDGQADVIAEARQLLREMEETFARMQADVRRGRDRAK
jgi:hypothetical protein